MKKILLVTLLAVGLVSSYAFADGKDVTVKGTVIDNACAGMHKADLATFVKTHDKMCAVKPACASSGYSIYSNGKLMKLDSKSSTMVTEFLKKADSKTDVMVMGDQIGDSIRVESIKNQ